MKRLLKILVVNSLTDLFKHKSFFLLVFVLVLVDRGLKLLKNTYPFELGLPELRKIDAKTADYIFNELPRVVVDLLGDYRIFLVLGGLFLLKQIISLWPSSDMRRMHRRERGQFGLLASLGAIRWEQLLWDAMAVLTLCLIAVGWCLTWFGIHRLGWRSTSSVGCLLSLGVSIGLILPIVLAGFSYSSKLAVISKGSFGEKLSLFYRLFFNWRIAWWSWLFYAVRIVIESIFVVAFPAYILMTVDNFFLRILLAALLATPVYSYLKMASFKFFLVLYEQFPLVKQEYESYYRTLEQAS